MTRFAKRANTVAALTATAALLVVVPSPAEAQAPGVRGGVSINPDQLYVGAHYETAPLIEQLHFKPNIELGFGDDLTLVAFNFEFVWKFPSQRDWTVYAGGGPALNWYSVDGGGSDTEGGFNVLFGAENSRGLSFEIKIGAIDSPDLKFGVGYSFR